MIDKAVALFKKAKGEAELFYYRCEICGKEFCLLNERQFKGAVAAHKQKHKGGVRYGRKAKK